MLLLVSLPVSLHAQQFIRHEMKITLQPDKHQVKAEDTITLPENLLPAAGGKLHFLLHGGLKPSSPTAGVKIILEKDKSQAGHFGLNSTSFVLDERLPMEHYTVTLPVGRRDFVLQYQGEIYHPFQQEGEQYARSFSETPGLISSEGIYLAGSTYWYPWFNDGLVTFSLELQIPEAWNVVSQGERTRHVRKDGWAHIRWESPEPQDEISLIGSEFTEYSRPAGTVQAMAFLRTPDEQLANKYIEATVQYLEMYSKLIGPYPYKKFALVENFWETGYGMPSFTLLGPKVIRFPFILHSSYPHEILHSWWGNSVFVDYQTGNWSEGLTAYLADHLVQEQRGTAVEYRRTTLQKYADYVSEEKDFPLTQFHSRHSSATEAVGYGKTLMFFHMLRQQLGDVAFTKGLQKFYRENKFRRATFSDLKNAFSSVAGEDLEMEFAQWVTRPGAPALHVREARARADGASYLLTAIVEQVQPGPAYVLRVPIAVHLDGQEKAYQTTVAMDRKRLELVLRVPTLPLRLDMDPGFDIFRRLNHNEIPPALTQAFGADKALILLPADASDEVRQGYRQLAESWQQSHSGQLRIKLDREIDELPPDRAIWLFGWENRFQPEMVAVLTDYDVSFAETGVRIGSTEIGRDNHSVVLSARHPANPDLALTWIATDNVSAMPGLGRKLPHYRKYSYLGFEGDEPTNIAKGQWPVVHSPMSVPVRQSDGSVVKGPRGDLAPRRALAYLPAVFSGERMHKVIRWLASDEMQGRGFGTPELDRAADFIAEQFREAGLQPAVDQEGSYFQTWKDHGGDPEREVVMKNVVGVIPGTKPEWAGQSVVIGAHYDHLGLGWPDVHQGDEGKIHRGADDNASGVAVLLELARVLGKKWKPDRTVVFVAFTGEETGLRGSKYYVAHEKRFPADKIIGMLNLDTVGRLEQRKLTIFGTGSAREWIHIFNGASFVTGVPVGPVAHDFGSGDQRSFLDAGVPAVHFFAGGLDYHRPTDTPDKIDSAGLVKTAAVVREAIEYLTDRAEPLSSTLDVRGDPERLSPDVPQKPRRVSLGTVPDFAYQGRGVRISGVVPGSPVEKAGLQAGDVIVRIGTTPIDDLRIFSDLLKKIEPGDSISITFTREGKEQTVETKVVPR